MRKYFKLVALILLFVSFTWPVDAQIEFAPINAKWYYNCCANGNIIDSHLNYIVPRRGGHVVRPLV